MDFNTLERTKQYCEDCLEYVNEKEKVFVIVENGNQDDTIFRQNFKPYEGEIKIPECYRDSIKTITMYCMSEDDIICIIYAKDNYGFAKANNMGAMFAKQFLETDKLLIICNNDIQFCEKISLRYYEELLEKNPELSLIGPKVVGLDGALQTPYKYLNLWDRWIKHLILWPLDEVFANLDKRNDILCDQSKNFVYRILGAFMIFKASDFYSIEMFDENTFLYYEECIIAEKLIKIGKETLYVDKDCLIHEGGATTGKAITTTKKIQCQFDSAMYYYETYVKCSKTLVGLCKVLFKAYMLKRMLLLKIVKR